MNPFENYLIETITYWGNPQPTQSAWFTFDAPVLIKGRWEDNSVIFIDADGNEQVSNAEIYTLEDVVLQSFVFRGESIEPDPKNVEFSYEVRGVSRLESLNGRVKLKRIIV